MSNVEYRGVNLVSSDGRIFYEGQIEPDTTQNLTYYQGWAPVGSSLDDVKKMIDKLANGEMF